MFKIFRIFSIIKCEICDVSILNLHKLLIEIAYLLRANADCPRDILDT